MSFCCQKHCYIIFIIIGDEIEHVNTICLPFGYLDGRTWAGKALVVAGWGVERNHPIPALRKYNIKFILIQFLCRK